MSVSVSVWTMVAISLERYFAICQPLRSRRWQTLSHSYKMIAAVWVGSFICMIPIAVFSQLLPMSSGRFKCREDWPDLVLEKIFNIFLDALLLVIPLIIMVAAYAKISFCLWKGIQIERHGRQAAAVNNCVYKITRNGVKKPQVFCFRDANRVNIQCNPTVVVEEVSEPSCVLSPRRSNSCSSDDTSPPTDQPPASNTRGRLPTRSIRTSNYDKSLAAKKHVIRMLVFVVLEFFICWTPLYVINTVSLFDPWSVYAGLGYTGISFFQLLAYISSCCNPITYCFMNRKFRQAFLQAFGCRRRISRRGTQTSTNGMSFYNRRSTIRTVVEDRESETAL